jgi:putative tricarboxylic transport membrane protein
VDLVGQFGIFFGTIVTLLANPYNWVLLVVSMVLGIVFGALPGLTATLGVALLTTLTYGLPLNSAMISLLAMYVGAVYGGSYASILINIPGTAAAAATALDGHPMALRGEGGRALGLTTTASFIGTILGTVALAATAPMIAKLALQFTSFEFFLLAFFGIVISGSLTANDLFYKSWIAGLLGLFLACIGRDNLQSYPRFTLGFSALEGGIEVVPVLIGAFGIPQIIKTMRDPLRTSKPQEIRKILPDWRTIGRQLKNVTRSALIGIGIGAVPGVGEDVAAWVSYGTAKNTSRNPERFGTGEPAGVVACETANNACIGGALIPLLTLGIPGSPPAAMLLGALLIHGVNPGPNLPFERPGFLIEVTAIMLLCSAAMWICGILLCRQVIKVLRAPSEVFLPIVGALCVIGSYAIGLNIVNLYLMVLVGVAAYFLQEMEYPIAPLVIGVILGPMADENLRRALMVSQGSFLPFFTRPVSILLLVTIVLVMLNQVPTYRQWQAGMFDRIRRRPTPA